MDFNVGIMLWPNDFGHFPNISSHEEYVQFRAYKVVDYWDNGRAYNVTNLTLVPCKAEDFHEGYGPLRDVFKEVITYAYCLPNYKDITLIGDHLNEVNEYLYLAVERCLDRPTCKNETEINEFLDKNGQVIIYMNEVNY